MADEGLERCAPMDVAPVDYARLQPRENSAVGYKTVGGYDDPYGREDDRVFLRELWRILRKRKWLIITIVFSVTSLVTIQEFRTRPIYQASTIIEIGKENSTVVKSGDLVINDDSDPFYQVNVKTKVLLLNSLELHEDVADSLRLDTNPNSLQSSSQTSIWKLLQGLIGNSRESGVSSDAEIPDDEFSNGEIVRSAEERARLAPSVEAIEDNLVVEPVRDTRAIKVSFTHNDPALAAAVANAIARSFMRHNFEAKTERFTDTATWLDRTTRELKTKVEEGEQALATYTQEHNIFAINSDDKRDGTTLTTNKLTRLHDLYLRAESDRMLKQTLYEEVKAGRITQLPDAFSDPKLIELQKQLNELNTAYAQVSVKFASKNPRVAEVQSQIAVVKQQIIAGLTQLEAKLRGDYERAVKDEQSLLGALENTKQEAAQENQAAIQYNILKQDLDTSRALYTDFLQKTNQAKAQVAEQHNNVRVIERASAPKKPVGPKRALMMTLAFVVSLGGSVGLVYFLEYIDNTVKSVEDVSRYIQLPALGVIPTIYSASGQKLLSGKKKGNRRGLAQNQAGVRTTRELTAGRLIELETRSSAAEAYRGLRTSVLLSSAGRPPKTLLITSSQPGEGKTTTCINTAVSLAQLGASVLVIDCDLRKPAAHKIFGLDHHSGLSTYLSREVEIDGLIQRLHIKNLSLITCGPIPPNPAELISSDKMKNLLELLAERYDHILIDSPPLMNVTDPVILSRMVEGVILVVHGG